ncbi:hypothetical protein JM654_07260 [Microbacterium oxydans]|nr:hypothetical protein [Microbacterium oxydans]
MAGAGSRIDPLLFDALHEHPGRGAIAGRSGGGRGELGREHERFRPETDDHGLIGDGDVLRTQLDDLRCADAEHEHQPRGELRMRIDGRVGGDVGEQSPAFVVAQRLRIQASGRRAWGRELAGTSVPSRPCQEMVQERAGAAGEPFIDVCLGE